MLLTQGTALGVEHASNVKQRRQGIVGSTSWELKRLATSYTAAKALLKMARSEALKV